MVMFEAKHLLLLTVMLEVKHFFNVYGKVGCKALVFDGSVGGKALFFGWQCLRQKILFDGSVGGKSTFLYMVRLEANHFFFVDGNV